MCAWDDAGKVLCLCILWYFSGTALEIYLCSRAAGQGNSGEGKDWYLKFCDFMSSILSSVLLILVYLVVPRIIACVFMWV